LKGEVLQVALSLSVVALPPRGQVSVGQYVGTRVSKEALRANFQGGEGGGGEGNRAVCEQELLELFYLGCLVFHCFHFVRVVGHGGYRRSKRRDSF